MSLANLPPETFTELMRLISVLLSLAVVLMLLFDRSSPWRLEASTQRLLATVQAMFITWYGWRSLRAALRDTPPDGWGTAIYMVILIAMLVALIVQSERARRAGKGVVIE